MYKMKTGKQEFLVICFALQHSDPGVKATWPITGKYYMLCPLLGLSSNCPPEGAGLGLLCFFLFFFGSYPGLVQL